MPPPWPVCVMQPFSHPWNLSPDVVSSSGQRLLYLEISKVSITLLDTILSKQKSPKSTVHPDPTGSPALQCLAGTAGEAEQGRRKKHCLYFHLQSFFVLTCH